MSYKTKIKLLDEIAELVKEEIKLLQKINQVKDIKTLTTPMIFEKDERKMKSLQIKYLKLQDIKRDLNTLGEIKKKIAAMRKVI